MSDDRLARQYLLGLLDDARREEAEARLAAGGEFAETVEAVERDLIDAWTTGELPPDEASRFRQYLASHPRTDPRLRFSRALHRVAETRRTTHRRHLAIAASLLAVIGAGYLGQSVWRQPGQVRVVSVMLQPGGLRSESPPQTVAIPPSAEFADIVLAESAGARTARVRFIDSGSEVWAGPIRNGVIRVPVSLLANGDHTATALDEWSEELADYVFRVIR